MLFRVQSAAVFGINAYPISYAHSPQFIGSIVPFALASASLKLVAPDSLSARNTMDKPNAVRAVDTKVDYTGNTLQFKLPRWSVGVVTVTKQ